MVLVSACGAAKTATPSPSATPEVKKEVKTDVTITAMAQTTQATKALTESFKKVEELTGIKVKLDTYPDDQFLNSVKTKLATGDAADIIIHPFGVYDIPSDSLEPLDGPWVEKITDVTKPNTLWKDKVVKAPYGGQSNMGLLYNKKVLAAAGVKLPLKNFSEFTAALDAIKKTGVTPLYLPNKENWTAQIIFLSSMTGTLANKPGLVDQLSTNKVKPQDVPELVKLWENALSLKTKGYLNSDYMSADLQMGYKAIAEGKAAFMPGGDWFYSDIAKDYPDQLKDIGMTVTPIWDDQKDGMVMNDPANAYISVAANSKNIEAAKKFVNAFMTEPVLKTFYAIQPGAVPYKDLGYELGMNDWNKEMLGYASTFKPLGDWANHAYDGKSFKMNPFWGDFNLQVQNLFAGRPAKDAIADWYKKYAKDAELKKFAGF
jgi:raffinose/stachyose/melibiose transport system substrate-binding protein